MCHLVLELTQDEIRQIDACGLHHLLYMPDITHNRGLLTTLLERWHSEHNIFHLPTGEISMTLKDVQRILHILMTGELVQYDYQDLGGTKACRVVFSDEIIDIGEIRWEDMIMYYKTLLVILGGLMCGFIYPNIRSQGFVGWDGILQSMMQHQTFYAWGVCTFSHLYHDLHHVVHDENASLSTGCTLLQVQCREHIVVTRPIHHRVRGDGQYFVYLYTGILTQLKLGKMEYWRWVLDSMETIIWRPYIECDPWLEDARALPLIFRVGT